MLQLFYYVFAKILSVYYKVLNTCFLCYSISIIGLQWCCDYVVCVYQICQTRCTPKATLQRRSSGSNVQYFFSQCIKSNTRNFLHDIRGLRQALGQVSVYTFEKTVSNRVQHLSIRDQGVRLSEDVAASSTPSSDTSDSRFFW